MTHLRIEQSGITEEVSHSLISKLYELAISGDLDQSSNLQGRIHVNKTYGIWADYLHNIFSNLYIQYDKSYIWFQDPVVKQVMAARFGNGQDGITVDDINVAYLWGDFNYYTIRKYITTFDELSQLTTINQTGQNTFFAQSRLTSIDLSNISNITEGSFNGCTALASLGSTNNVIQIGNGAFCNCSGLTSISLPSCTSIGIEAFKNCTNLTTVTLNPALTSLPQECFNGCSNLSNIDFSNITNFGNAAFQDCTSLGANTDLDFDLDGKTFSPNVFRNTGYRSITLHEITKNNISGFAGSGQYDTFGALMPNLIKFDLSDTKQTNIKALYSNNLTTLILPETYTGSGSEGRDWGTSLLYIICLQLNPASVTKPNSYWGFAYMPANCAIYVPDSVYQNYVDAWITNSDDPIPSSRIKPISELPSSVTWYTKEHPSS